MEEKVAVKFIYRCRLCRHQQSLFKSTFFSKCQLTINQVIHIGYLWFTQCKSATILALTGLSKSTVANWTENYRQLVEWDLHHLDVEYAKIGGRGIVVEADESKFGKRKYHRGHRVEGVWVVGGVERTKERRMLAVTVANRSAATHATRGNW